MGVTLADRTILVNLPQYRGEGKGQCIFLRYKSPHASGLSYVWLGIINAYFDAERTVVCQKRILQHTQGAVAPD